MRTRSAAINVDGKRVKVELSAPEMNTDNVIVIFSDASGDEWCDLLVNHQTTIDIYPADISLTTDEATGGRRMDGFLVP